MIQGLQYRASGAVLEYCEHCEMLRNAVAGQKNHSKGEEGIFYTPWQFTGQWFDLETGQYDLRARQYSPYLGRFTSYDPVRGDFERPLTLHKYLYCGNDRINRIDPWGELYEYGNYFNHHFDSKTTYSVVAEALDLVGTNYIMGPLKAFGPFGPYIHGSYDYKDTGNTFQISEQYRMKGSEFGNYCAGYALYYNYGMTGLGAAYAGGQLYGDRSLLHPHGLSTGLGYDDWGSIFFIAKGGLDANRRALDWFENPTINPLLRPGTLSDITNNPVQRFAEKTRLRWEGKGLTYWSQFAEAMWMADGGI